MKTVHELCDYLESIDEVDLLELLDITSEELVAKFKDKIEDQFEYLLSELDNLNKEEEENE